MYSIHFISYYLYCSEKQKFVHDIEQMKHPDQCKKTLLAMNKTTANTCIKMHMSKHVGT